MLRMTFQQTVAIRGLWVAGSYARGALQCGDLDVILLSEVVDRGSGSVSLRKLVRPTFGHIPYLRCYHGTPKENSSGIEFVDAVQVWAPKLDWRAAISAIRADPQAQRFERPTDVVPLRVEQIYGGVDAVLDLIERHKQQILSWSFTSIDPAHSPLLGECSDAEEHFMSKRWRNHVRVTPSRRALA